MSCPRDEELSGAELVEVVRSRNENASGEALPEGWAWTTLKEIVNSITYGHTASASYEPVGPRFLRITDIQNGRVDWDSVPFCECDDMEKYALKNGDIVIARTGATTGKNFLIGDLSEQSVFASYLIRLETLEDLSAEFLSNFMQTPHYWQQITTVSKGSTQPGANASILSKLAIPVAPKAEQSRIVSAIESLQERSSRARELLSEVGPLIGQLRQSVLRSAFSGRLTSDWREQNPTTEPASELLLRIRTERRERWEAEQLEKYEAKGKQPPQNWQDKYKEPEPVDESELPELPDGWCWCHLGMLGADPMTPVQTGPFGAQLHTDEFVDDGVPVIAVGNLTGVGFTKKKLYFVTDEKAQQLSRYDVQAGDLLFARSGATLGKVCVAPDFVEDWRMTGHILRARLNPELILPEIAVYALWGDPTVKSMVTKGIRGMTRPGYNTTLLKAIPLPVAPIEEQRQMLAVIEEAFDGMESVSSLRVSMESSLTQLDQSILAKAFRGELVPQDPRDEPASVLLDRIKSERVVKAQSRHNPRKKSGIAIERNK